MPPMQILGLTTCSVALLLLSDASGAEAPESPQADLRVMTFNIRYDNPQDGDNRWELRRDWVAEILQSNKIHIAGLQEALRRQIQDLQTRLPEFAWYGVGRDDGQEQGEFAPIFYRRKRFELLDKSTFWLSSTPDQPGSRDWDAAVTRITSWVKLRDRQTGRTLFVFNAHFDHRSAHAREESAKLLLAQIERIAGTHPVVVTGDFNCPPLSPPYRILTSGVAGASEMSTFCLADAWKTSATGHDGPNSTWNGFHEIVPGLRIDFIFTTTELQVHSHRILNHQRDGRFPSDHFPVVAELGLRKSGP